MELRGGAGQKCEGLSFDSNVPPDPEAGGPWGRWPGLGVLPMAPNPAPCQPQALRFFRTYVGLLKHKFGGKGKPTY